MKAYWIVYPFCSIFILVGASILVQAMRNILKARAIESWPRIAARIKHVDLKSESGETAQEVIVSYSYVVNGQEFISSKIHPCYGASSFDGHAALFERLKAASVVQARYNEHDPKDSFIVVGNFSSTLVLPYAGLLFLSMGICFLLIFHFALTGSSDFVSGLEIVE